MQSVSMRAVGLEVMRQVRTQMPLPGKLARSLSTGGKNKVGDRESQSVRLMVKSSTDANKLLAVFNRKHGKHESLPREVAFVDFVAAVCEIHGADRMLDFAENVVNTGNALAFGTSNWLTTDLFRILATNHASEDEIKRACELVVKLVIETDEEGTNALVQTMLRAGMIAEARNIVTSLNPQRRFPWQERTVKVAYETLMMHGSAEESEQMIHHLDYPSQEMSVDALQTLLRGYARTGEIGKAKEIWQEMKARGISSNTVSYNGILEAHMIAKEFAETKQLIDEMWEKNIKLNTETYNIQLRVRLQEKDQKGIEILLQNMRISGIPLALSTVKILAEAKFQFLEASHVEDFVQESMRTYNLEFDSALLTQLVEGFSDAILFDSAWKMVNVAKLENLPVRFEAIDKLAFQHAKVAQMDQAEMALQMIPDAEEHLPLERTVTEVGEQLLATDKTQRALNYLRAGFARGFRGKIFCELLTETLYKEQQPEEALQLWKARTGQEIMSSRECCFLISCATQVKDLEAALTLLRALETTFDKLSDATAFVLEQGMGELTELLMSANNFQMLQRVRSLAETRDFKLPDRSQDLYIEYSLVRGESKEALRALENMSNVNLDVCRKVMANLAKDGDVDGCNKLLSLHPMKKWKSEYQWKAFLIEAYGRSGLTRRAEKIFNDYRRASVAKGGPSSSVLNAMLISYAENDNERKALNLLAELKKTGLVLSGASLSSLVQMYTKRKQIQRARSVLEASKGSGRNLDRNTLAMYIEASLREGRGSNARQLFETLQNWGITAEISTYSDILQFLSESGDYECVKNVFLEMERKEMKPSSTCYLHMVSCCEKGGSKAISILQPFLERVPASLSVHKALMKAYSSSEEFALVIEEWENYRAHFDKDTDSLNIAINAFSKVGRVEEATKLVKHLQRLKGEMDTSVSRAFISAVSEREDSDLLAPHSYLERCGIHIADFQAMKAKFSDNDGVGSEAEQLSRPTEMGTVNPDPSRALLRLFDNGDSTGVLRMFRDLISEGALRLEKDAFRAVAETTIMTSSAADAMVMASDVMKRGIRLPPEVYMKTIEYAMKNRNLELLFSASSEVIQQQLKLDDSLVIDLLSFFIKGLHMEYAQRLYRFVLDKNETNPSLANKLCRMLMEASASNGLFHAMENVFTTLGANWRTPIEFETILCLLELHIHGEKANIRQILHTILPLLKEREPSSVFNKLIEYFAQEGNIMLSERIQLVMQEEGLTQSDEAIRAVSDAYRRNGEYRAARLVKA